MIELEPVAFVKNSRSEISDDYWGKVISEIELTSEYEESSLAGIEEFSHLEIIFYFDKVNNSAIKKSSHHPRNNADWPKAGIFSQRGKNRPNKLGLTIVKLIKKEGRKLIVSGLDAIDGTPVLDIKPVVKEFLPSGDILQPEWMSALMKNYWA